MKCATLLLILNLFLYPAHAQVKPFRFAFISDTHIGSPNGGAEEDLRRTVADINAQEGIDFVVLTGDITELGKEKELSLAKQILDSLRIKWYIIPGNHDTGWSESGGLGYTRTFGYDRFHFVHNGIHFFGCASGPYVRMSDGHVPRSHLNWLKAELKKVDKKTPVVFLNHYPLDEGLDNWYEIVDLLKTKNTILALCGHGHANRPVQAEDIPAVMGRSNLRAKAAEGGYNLVDVRPDSILFTERKPVSRQEKKWTAVAWRKDPFPTGKTYKRPDFSINQHQRAEPLWTYQSAANIISTPAVSDRLAIYGNQDGVIEAVSLKLGKVKWRYNTGGPVYSSPAILGDRVVLGSSDGNAYCLDMNGKLQWKFAFNGPVLGSVEISGDTAFIGASDHTFRALSVKDGRELWRFDSLQGPVTSVAVMADSFLVFGAWDTYLYALHKSTGKLLWKWNNGSTVINYSPAACIPVIKNGVVYIAAPDRALTAIDLLNGQTLWRTKEFPVRESIGISEDGKLVYAKTMQDTVVAFHAGRNLQPVAWKIAAGYGYEHAPSMLIEKRDRIYFGTRSGTVFALSPETKTVTWRYKLDNSMVNTVSVLPNQLLLATTMDGKVSLLLDF